VGVVAIYQACSHSMERVAADLPFNSDV
jgi:hypothetical protein